MAAQSSGRLVGIEHFACHRRILVEALDTARRLAEEAQPLTQVVAAETLATAVSHVDRLCRGGHERPSLLIVGQVKAGKSSLINELLGEHAVAQSSSPCTSTITRLTHSPEPFVRRQPDPDGLQQKDGSLAEVVIGQPCEFLATGLDLVDTPGLNENSRLDELTLAAIASHLPIVVYVIDANNGISRMVEADILRVGALTGGPERLFFLIAKMDVDKADADEASGRTLEALEREKLERLLAGLRRVGCLGPDADRLLCCVSARHVAAARRRLRRQRQPTPEETRWLAAFQRARQALLEFANHRLQDLVTGVAACLRRVALTDLHAGLAAAATKAEDSGYRRRHDLLDIGHSAGRLNAESTSTAALAGSASGDLARRLGELLRRSRKEVRTEVMALRCCGSRSELPESADVSRCVAKICAAVSSPLLLDRIQQCALASMLHCFLGGVRLMEQMQAFSMASAGANEQLLAALAELRSFILAGYRAPAQLLRLSPERLQQLHLGSKTHRGLLRRPKLPTTVGGLAHETEWRELVAENFLRSMSPVKLAKDLAEDVHRWLDQRHDLASTALRILEDVGKHELQVSEEKKQKILTLQPECLKLSFRLSTVLTECRFMDSNWDKMLLIATGSQGSKLYRIADATDAAAAFAVKDTTLNDDALTRMAASLLFCSNESGNSDAHLVGIIGMRLLSLDADQTASGGSSWRLQLAMEFLPVSLRVYLQDASRSSLSDRLGLGLATCEAVAQLHSQRVAHRNLKLTNVFVCDIAAPTVKLSDLGQRLSAQSTSGALFGELAGEDVRSLGLILTCLALGSADTDGLDAGDLPATLRPELQDLLRECAEQPEPGGICSLSALKLVWRLQALLRVLAPASGRPGS